MPTTTDLLACDDDIRELLSSLLDADVKIERLKSSDNPHQNAYIATYGNNDDKCQALCFCDLSFANLLGAALALIPQGYAEECTKANEFPENLRENFNEVMNLCANLFPKQRSAGFSLQAIDVPTEDIPANISSFLEDETVERADLEITIERYGCGVLTLLTK